MNAPPSINLALMAWKLASSRALAPGNRPQLPQPRYTVEGLAEAGWFPVSRDYYAIIDRISAGEAP